MIRSREFGEESLLDVAVHRFRMYSKATFLRNLAQDRGIACTALVATNVLCVGAP